MKLGFVVLLLLAPFGAGAEAQEAAVGRTPTVRVQLRNLSRVEGFLRGRSADELVVYTSDAQFRRVPFTDVRRFEVHSRMGSHWRRGILTGLLMGAGVVATAPVDFLNDAGVASWQSAVVMAGGAALGGAIGAAVPRYGWREADPRTAWSEGRPAAPLQVQVTLRF
jgi:hypothetical protein